MAQANIRRPGVFGNKAPSAMRVAEPAGHWVRACGEPFASGRVRIGVRSQNAAVGTPAPRRNDAERGAGITRPAAPAKRLSRQDRGCCDSQVSTSPALRSGGNTG